MKHFLVAIVAVLSVLTREQLVSSATTGCPRRYLRRINGKCYYFSVKKMNWFGALNNCLRKGLTLADLSNPRDFYGAVDFLSSKGNTEDFWFGGNDLQTEGRFQYSSSGRLVRYYGNYSVISPAEHSECDDCLEVRIRTNLTVVADDNCMERQYFICSERYCDAVNAKKPRHHSHEHLHHFHHDIGEPSEEAEQELNTPSPFDSAPADESIKIESEEDTLADDVPDKTTPEPETETETETAAETETEAETEAEPETETAAETETESAAKTATETATTQAIEVATESEALKPPEIDDSKEGEEDEEAATAETAAVQESAATAEAETAETAATEATPAAETAATEETPAAETAETEATPAAEAAAETAATEETEATPAAEEGTTPGPDAAAESNPDAAGER